MKPAMNEKTPAQQRGIPAMTGIRGLACVWVLLFHIQLEAGQFFGLPFLERLPFLNRGWHAVDLFFMLSGFILMYAHQKDFQNLRKSAIIRFAKLRFTRVYPLNTAVLLLIGVLALSSKSFISWMRAMNSGKDFSSGAFVQTLFLANRWFLPRSGSWNEPVWSLSLEIIGYAVFPFLAFLAIRLKTRIQAFSLAAISLSAFVYVSFVRHMLFTNMLNQIAITRMLSCFIVGIAVFRLWELTDTDQRTWASGLATSAMVGIAVACIVPRGELALNALFAVLLFALAFRVGIISSLLSSPVMMFLGKISFPLYLIHGIVFWWLRYFMVDRISTWSHEETLMLLLAGFVGCIVLSTILHALVEKPAHMIGRRWANA